MADFEPEDKNSWYFGAVTREDANERLMGGSSGTFLVRDSSSIKDDFVLCVKEDNKVSHYIINKIQVGNMIQFRIGDQEFPDLPSLLNFYKTHYLDTTSLIRPAPRDKYVAKFDFAGRDPEDLPFRRGDILAILQRDEDQWWTARNEAGDTGLIPVPYVQRYDAEMERNMHEQAQANNQTQIQPSGVSSPPPNVPNSQRALPARARVIKQRVPNAYDTTALRLEVGDEVMVTRMNLDGQWYGDCEGRQGYFPFTHIQFIEEEDGGDIL